MILTLLTQHDGMSCQSRSPIPRHCEQFGETLEEVVSFDDLVLFDQLSVNVVHVTGGLKVGESKATKRTVSLRVSAWALPHQPSWRLCICVKVVCEFRTQAVVQSVRVKSSTYRDRTRFPARGARQE
jgi:hypothetical protein